jgi:hypothetical protein
MDMVLAMRMRDSPWSDATTEDQVYNLEERNWIKKRRGLAEIVDDLSCERSNKLWFHFVGDADELWNWGKGSAIASIMYPSRYPSHDGDGCFMWSEHGCRGHEWKRGGVDELGDEYLCHHTSEGRCH